MVCGPSLRKKEKIVCGPSLCKKANKPTPVRTNSCTISFLHKTQQALATLTHQRSKSETRINGNRRSPTQTDENKANTELVINNPNPLTWRRTTKIQKNLNCTTNHLANWIHHHHTTLRDLKNDGDPKDSVN
jgi:hypothetical protein